jgi:hypothetical protein
MKLDNRFERFWMQIPDGVIHVTYGPSAYAACGAPVRVASSAQPYERVQGHTTCIACASAGDERTPMQIYDDARAIYAVHRRRRAGGGTLVGDDGLEAAIDELACADELFEPVGLLDYADGYYEYVEDDDAYAYERR